jgi:ribose transport system permease protein
LIFYILQPERFGSLESIFLLIQQSFVPTITSMGLLYIIIMGLFDFSIGSILVMSSLVGLSLVQNFGYAGLIIGCLFTAVFLEFINALLYSLLKIPSLIITVGTLMIFESLGSFVSNTDLWMPVDMGAFGRFPANVILGLFVMLLAYIIIDRTRFGIYVQAIGQSETISKSMGVNPAKIKFLGFLICGLFVGLGSVSLCSFNGGMVAQIDMNSMTRVFTPMIGCFIGITLKKYCNVVVGIFIGQFILSMITLGLITMKVDVAIQNFITGFFLIMLVALSKINKKEEVVK